MGAVLAGHVTLGVLRRRIRIAVRDSDARGVVEDDFHHFRVWLRADGRKVASVDAEAVRRPWTLCALAATQLHKLVGMPLSTRASALLAQTDKYQQCTHMLDLAGLCIAALARGTRERVYDATVPDRIDDRTQARLFLDGVPKLAWEVEGSRIVAPRQMAGIDLRSGFQPWTETLDEGTAEAALVLRRAIFISGGRGKDLDAVAHSSARGGCFVQQPERAAAALRMTGSTRDFSDTPELLALSDEAWLAFDAQPDPS